MPYQISDAGEAVREEGFLRLAVVLVLPTPSLPGDSSPGLTGSTQGAHQVDGNGARRLLAFGGGHGATKLAHPGLAVTTRNVPADEDE